MTTASASEQPAAAVYRSRHRLSGSLAFAAVYGAKMRQASGPLLVHTRPREGPAHRLGLSVSRRVGKAVVRNRIKRLLREAFRLDRAAWPAPEVGGAYDIVVSVRPHEPMTLASYRRLLTELVERSHRSWIKRSAR